MFSLLNKFERLQRKSVNGLKMFTSIVLKVSKLQLSTETNNAEEMGDTIPKD